MNKEKRLMDIELELETFHAHLKKLRKKPGSLHRLDIELLQEKTRKLYDKLYDLENTLAVKGGGNEKIINLPENMPKAEIPVTTETKVAISPQPEKKEVTSPAISKPDPKIKETKEKAVVEDIKPVVNEPMKEEPKKDIKEPPAAVQTENTSKPELQSEEKVESTRSTIDLFSDSSGVSIGDKLGGNGDSTIASKMQKTSIKDLKQAIGINEKFLFINDLFNGDLGRYNKVIDEFNGLSSREGTNAHLIELKVQNQWDENNEAYLKLKDLLDRKFD